MLGSTVLVFQALAESIYTSRVAKKGRHDDAQRVDGYAKGIYATLFLLLVVFALVV